MKNKFFNTLFQCFNVIRNMDTEDKEIKSLQKNLNKIKESEFFVVCVSEHENLVRERLNETIELHAKKRREEEVVESFEDIKEDFQGSMGRLLKFGNNDFTKEYKESFASELFNEFYDCKESEDKISISIKNSNTNTNINSYIYIKQWWKPKFLESKNLEEHVLCLEGLDLYFDHDIMAEGFQEALAFYKPKKDYGKKITESVEYLPPQTADFNLTDMPSWIKKVEEGKVSIKESSMLERILEFPDKSFKMIREKDNSDFWKIIKNN